MNGKRAVKKAIESHRKAVDELLEKNTGTIIAIAEMIVKSLRRGGCVYTCGNGGSAADAQHIAAELVCRFEKERRGLAAAALTTDSSILTAVSNDYGYERVFARQVEALVKKGDVFWGISTSGTSANVLKAAAAARQKGASIVAFTGKPRSKLEKSADICLCANSNSTAISQEIHQIAYHIICRLVEEGIGGNNKAR